MTLSPSSDPTLETQPQESPPKSQKRINRRRNRKIENPIVENAPMLPGWVPKPQKGKHPLQYYTQKYPHVFKPIHRIHINDVTQEFIEEWLYIRGEPFVIEGCFMGDLFVEDTVEHESDVKQEDAMSDETTSNSHVTMGHSVDNFMEDTNRSRRPAEGNVSAKDAEYEPLTQEDIAPKTLETSLPLFSLQYLSAFHSDMPIRPRDNKEYRDEEGWTLGPFVEYLKEKPTRYSRRVYAKDVPCPVDWRDTLFQHEKFPKLLVNRGNFDIMGHLPANIRPITLMNYLGSDGTYTPAHIDVAGTLGHNIMVACAPDAFSLWAVANRRDLGKVQELFKKHDADLVQDNMFMHLDKLAKSDFQWNLFEQRRGDFIVLPSNCAHQVQNYNGYSMKIAWNNLTPKALRDAMATQTAYRNYRKDTVYRLKSIAYFSLQRMVETLRESDFTRVSQAEDLHALLTVYSNIVHNELIRDTQFDEKGAKMIPEDPHSTTCDHCRADIFNRYYFSPSEEKDVCLNCTVDLGARYKDLELFQSVSMEQLTKVLDSAVSIYNTVRERLQGEMNAELAEFSTDHLQNTPSAADEAYRRQKQRALKDTQYCHFGHHECVGNQIHCKECNEHMCFECLKDMFQYEPNEIIFSRQKCPICTGTCYCIKCKPKGSTEFKEKVAQLLEKRKAAATTFYDDEEDEKAVQNGKQSRKRKRTEAQIDEMIQHVQTVDTVETTSANQSTTTTTTTTTNNVPPLPDVENHNTHVYNAMEPKRRRLLALEKDDSNLILVSRLHRRLDTCRKCYKKVYDVLCECRHCRDYKVCLVCREKQEHFLGCPVSTDKKHAFVVHCFVCACCDQLINGVVFASNRVAYCDSCYHHPKNMQLIAGKEFQVIIPALATTSARPKLQDEKTISQVMQEESKTDDSNSEKNGQTSA